ncbi:MAG: hypothetical protein M3P12_05620 [Gemmatimonadota bacterium]|nr:hypothetical protein [Gemmatimonadota bacterium]
MLIVFLPDTSVELVPQETHEGRRPSPRMWQPIHPEAAARLTDSRLQLHHAAQFAAAAGISFLQHLPDNSHTSLEWVPMLGGLFSRVVPAQRAFRVGVRPIKLAILIASEDNQPISEYPLHGRTITEARDWIRSQATLLGADGSHYSLTRDYEIPRHDVAIGESFDASEQSCFEELSKWFANGAAIIGSLARATDTASEVRCWPHHFDIGTLIKVASGRTIGVGLEPGDDYYDEPYFYVNMRPQPTASRARSRPLWGSGTWHTDEWVGAVLCGSRLGSASSQERQTREFLDSAVSACRAMLTLD